MTLGRLINIPLAINISQTIMLTGMLIISIIANWIVLFFPYSGTAMWVGTSMLGFGLSGILGTIMSLTESYINVNGKIGMLLMFGMATGEMGFPLLIGNLTT
jgi:hypothetical protein